MANNKNYRILSLDGGGIRGVLTITLLKRLQDAHPEFLNNVDLVAGTSTGGILALAIAAGKSLDVVLELYKEKGGLVFADSPWDDLKDMGNAFGAEYSNEGLKKALKDEFKGKTLGDLEKKVVIVSFDLDNESVDYSVTRSWKPKIFHNYREQGAEVGSDEREKVVDIALRTAAAPTFFPVYQGYIDGGVVANNPSMCALAQALDKNTGGQTLSRIALLSVSTGGFPKFITMQDADWGWTQWARPIIDIMMEGSVGVADYQCKRVLRPGRYYRVEPRLMNPIALDSLDKIEELEKAGQIYDLKGAIQFVKKYF